MFELDVFVTDLWTLLFVRRGLLPNIMILLCILFLLDCLLFHAGHDLLMITQVSSLVLLLYILEQLKRVPSVCARTRM